MYQPLRNEQPQHYGATPVVAYAVPSAPRVCELYASGQSKVVGILLIIAGVLSIGLNIAAIIFVEFMAFTGDGIWFGIPVSLSCFMALLKCKCIGLFFEHA